MDIINAAQKIIKLKKRLYILKDETRGTKLISPGNNQSNRDTFVKECQRLIDEDILPAGRYLLEARNSNHEANPYTLQAVHGAATTVEPPLGNYDLLTLQEQANSNLQQLHERLQEANGQILEKTYQIKAQQKEIELLNAIIEDLEAELNEAEPIGDDQQKTIFDQVPEWLLPIAMKAADIGLKKLNQLDNDATRKKPATQNGAESSD